MFTLIGALSGCIGGALVWLTDITIGFPTCGMCTPCGPVGFIPFGFPYSLAGSLCGAEVGGLVGAVCAPVIGLCEGCCVTLGGLESFLGGVAGGLFQICGGLINFF